MLGSTILDVAIGVIFVFILVSIICSAIREGLESLLKTRAAHLEHGIRELLHDRDGTGLARDLFNHPLVSALYPADYGTARTVRTGNRRPWGLARGGDLPSYIPSRSFATALMDLAVRGREITPENSSAGAPVLSLQSLRDGVGNLGNDKVQRALLTAIDSAQGDLNRAQANIEAWYDGSMDRVSGWYKRSTHKVIFVVALFLAVALNVDTVAIAGHLYRDSGARAALVARAGAVTADTGAAMGYDAARAALDSLPLPIGWGRNRYIAPGIKGFERNWMLYGLPVIGWLMTALAATLGAPFWFDVLNKVMVIRSTVKPHEKSKEEGSEDRGDPRPIAAGGALAAGAGQTAPSGAGAIAQSARVRGAAREAAGGAIAREPAEDVDGCGGGVEVLTTDEDLPPAHGGVE